MTMTETMESKSGHEGLPESNQPQVSEQLFYCLSQNTENERVPQTDTLAQQV